MGNIHGCTNVATWRHVTDGHYPISEGQCGLAADNYGNGPAIHVWVWAKKDVAGHPGRRA